MRLAVVTREPAVVDDELAPVAPRLAAALGTAHDVHLLTVGPDVGWTAPTGGFDVLRFTGGPASPARREVLERVLFDHDHEPGGDCDCPSPIAPVSERMQAEWLRAGGGDAPALYDHLARASYDLVLFAGPLDAATVFGSQALPPETRLALLPVPARRPEIPLVRTVLDRAARLLALGPGHASHLRRRLDDGGADRVREIGFPMRVNRLATETWPLPMGEGPMIVLVADEETALPVVDALASSPVRVCAFGRFAEQLPDRPNLIRPRARARIDRWRWMARAVAVVDPEPRPLLGRSIAEAMLLGVPVVVPADGGATRESTEAGNGGLWYRTSAELRACLDLLLANGAGPRLGAQGRTWAERRFGDSRIFVENVLRAVEP